MKKLFVGSLAYECNDDDLKELFEAHGTVDSAKIVMDRYTGRSRGFGFVEMSSEEEAGNAIKELDGKEIKGRTIVVKEAHDKGHARR